MSVLKTAQGIEKLQLDSNLNSSLSNSVQATVEEELTINKVSMKKLTSGKVDDGSVSPPHGGKKRREEEHPSTPIWQTRECYSDDMIGLHKEANDFYDYIKPTSEEADMRKYVVENLRDSIQQMWPSMKMEVFGSYRTDLYLPTSDIDVVLLGECASPAQKLFMLRDGLIERGIADSVRVLDRAVVPIIKFTHRILGVKVDISINQDKGLACVNYIKGFLAKFPNLPKLIFVIKQFLVSRELNEVWHGGLSSYALIAMCISFLQLHADPASRNPESNLGVLLQEFFELYGVNFNYERICIRIKDGGRYIPKSDFTSSLDNGQHGQPTYSLLTIEDPLTEGNDLGRGSYAMHRVREAFQIAYRRLMSRQKTSKTASVPSPVETMLEMVLKVPEDMHKNRQSCLDCWRKFRGEIDRTKARIMPSLQLPSNPVIRHAPSQIKFNGDQSLVDQACQIRPAEMYPEQRAAAPPTGITVLPVNNDKQCLPNKYGSNTNPKKKPFHNNKPHHQAAVPPLPQQLTTNNLPRHQQGNVVIDPLQESARGEPKRNGTTDNKRPMEYGNGDLRNLIEESKNNRKSRNSSEKVRQNATYGKNRGGTATVSRANSNPSNRKFTAATTVPMDRKNSSSSR